MIFLNAYLVGFWATFFFLMLLLVVGLVRFSKHGWLFIVFWPIGWGVLLYEWFAAMRYERRRKELATELSGRLLELRKNKK